MLTHKNSVGGERAIEQSEVFYREPLGTIDAARVASIRQGLPYLVDRVMGEASLYEPDLAALALAQSGGDLSEAVLLLRAWRTTQPRFRNAQPIGNDDIFTLRRISAAFKDIPGGQVLGPSLDYCHRVLDVDVLVGLPREAESVTPAATPAPPTHPALSKWQRRQGLMAEETALAARTEREEIPDVTREPLLFPASRAHKLQSLARADTGGLMTLGYATMRGYGSVHPTINELRLGEAELRLAHPNGTIFSAGRVRVCQAEIISKTPEGMRLGFSASFGWNEAKVIAAATLDLASSETDPNPASGEEFVLHHTEPLESAGMINHLKLPHYVTFQSSLDALRQVRRDREQSAVSQQAATRAQVDEVTP